MQPNVDFWRGKTVAVTGGTGFLGLHLVRMLLEAGASVRVLGLEPPAAHPLRGLAVDARYGDLMDAGATRAALAGCDVVFHAAGNVAVWGPGLAIMQRLHLDGTRLVLDAADPGATVVHTSSIVAVGAAQTPTVFDEDSPFPLADVPVDYIHAKRGAEAIALAAATQRRVVVVNPGYLIGPDDPGRSVMGRVCERAWRGRLFVAPRSGYNLVDVRDVALGHLLAAERGVSGRRYILGGENRVFGEFLRLLAEVAGMNPRGILPLPSRVMGTLAWFAERRSARSGKEPYPSRQQTILNRYWWYVSSARAERELGYAPRPLAESLTDAFRWWTAQASPLRLRGFNRWWMRPAA